MKVAFLFCGIPSIIIRILKEKEIQISWVKK